MAHKALTTYTKGSNYKPTPFSFATAQEVEDYLDMACQQNIMIADYQVIETAEPASHSFTGGKLMKVLA
jgi:SepF-like predicted cell division protein (DUF552 family)